jgi:SAM-dependent methyltransferase
MKKNQQSIINSLDIPESCKYYWNYQYLLAKKVLVSYLSGLNAFHEGFIVTEIGCGEGGVLSAFVEAGASKGIGTDIDIGRIKVGEKIVNKLNLNISFSGHDIIGEEPKDEWLQKSDLVLLRDVIEHLEDSRVALSNIKKIIKPGGYLFVTFPPYHSPFGGHQHIAYNLTGKLPYIHLLPKKLFFKLVAIGKSSNLDEIKRIRQISLTPKKFLKASQETGFSIIKQDYYLLRPVFKMKFGLPAIKLTGISFLPLIKKYFSLEASYLLRKDKT